MPIGSDETIDIAIRARYDGIKQSIDELKRLGSQLTAIDKQLRSGLNSDALNKQFAETARQFDKVAKAVRTGSSDSSKSIATVTAQVQRLNAEMSKAQQSKGVGFVGAKADPRGFKQYQQSMEAVGTPVMGGAKNIGMLVRNMRNLNTSLGDTSKAGILTKASFDAVAKGGSVAFMSPLTKSEQLSVKLKSLRANIEGLTQSMQSMAKDRQWIGRQMIEGITLPIVGMGTMAVRSFMSVQSEMIQLKKVTEFGEGKASADAFYDSLVNGTQGIREMSREFGIGRKSATALFKDVAALGVDGEQDIKAFSNAVSEIALVGDVDTSTAMQFFRTMNAIFAGGKTNAEGLAETRDLMAQMSAVADETSLQLGDLAQAFPEVAPVMAQMGFSAAGVAASLAGMYKRGIPATEAAHGLKFALQRLVSPTKDAGELINKMGFTFFDASGNIKKADIEIMAMAKNLEEGMSAEGASKALGELFGLRQSARMKSYFQDVNIGRKELEAFTAGTLQAADMTSDYARGLVAAGFGVKGAVGPINRYNKALEEIKKDPTTGLKRLKAAFDDFKVQLGATIAPALLQVGEQLTKLLDAFTNLPAGMQIAIVGAAGFLAVLGPIRYMSAQATHAISSMGQVAVKVLPKMAQMSVEASAMMAAAGRRDFAMVGTRAVDLLSRKDARRLKYGLPTMGEKAAKLSGASALGPETAATGTLTGAKQALTAASAQVLAAETAEIAAHNANTAAMTAQAVVTNKGVAFDPKVLRWRNLNTGAIISQTEALKMMTAAQLAQYNVANRVNAGQNIKNVKNALAPMTGAAAPTAVAGASAGQIAMVKAIRAREAARLAQLPPPPVIKTPLISGDAAGKTKDIFKSLWVSANTTFFTPVGNAAVAAKNKIVAMGVAIQASSAGQAVAGGFAATAGAFTKGRKGGLGGDAAGLAMMASYGKVGKIFGSLGQIFGKFTGVIGIGSGPIGKILTLLLRFNKVTLILSAVAGAIAFVVMMFKGMKTNWEAVMAKIQPGIDAIKASFGKLKEVFAGVFEKMTGIFGQLGSGAEKGAGAASAFEGIGGIIGKVFEGIAAAIGFVGTVINFIMPYFEMIAYVVKNTVGFISSLFQGEWKQAFMFFVAIVYESVRPIGLAFDVMLKAIAQGVSSALGFIKKIINNLSDIPGLGFLKGWAKSIGEAQKAVEEFSDTGVIGMLDEKLRGGLGGVFGPGTTGPAKTEAKKAGGDIGETLGEAINTGAGDSADGESWVKKWIEKVVSQIDKQLEKIRKSATDALEKANEAALKVYDDRIKAIEDQEKAEEKLYRTEEYLANKRNLLAKRNIDRQNYENERAIAIYEGRYNDARMLDLKEQADKQSYSDELTGIEDSRSKDLLKETRDGLKEIITAEKEAAKTKFDIQKQSFEDYLDLLFEMTPVTVQQFQNMMDQINEVLQQNGATWPGYAETAMSRMGEALRKANKDVINEFNRSENNPLLQWVAAFAEPEVVRILKEGLSKATGGGGGLDGSGGGATAKTPEQELQDFLASLPSKSSQATPEELAAWVGTGQGMGNSERSTAPSFDEVRRNTTDALSPLDQAIALLKQGVDITDTSKYLFAKEIIDEAKKRIKESNESKPQGSEQGGNENKLTTSGEAPAVETGLAYKEARAEIDKTTAKLKEYGRNWSNVVVNNTTNWPKIFSKSVDKVEIYQDALKQNWVNVNGKLTNTWGETGEIIQTEHGQMIKYMNAGQVKYEAVSVKTYTTAKEVFEEMISQGIKPGTEAARVYEEKINDLGGAVAVIDGKSIFIPIRLDDWAFWSSLENINKFLNTLALKNRIIAQTGFSGTGVIIKDTPDGGFTTQAPGGGPVIYFAPGTTDVNQGRRLATGGLVKAQKDGILANIGEGGFDEFVITTDPKYRASNLGYLSAAASKLGVKMASGAAIKAASGGMFTSSGAGGSSAEYASGMGGDVYINVDTFIGEEEWFASMASKYNMKTVPRQRKIEGQQKRVVSSYNDRYRLR